MDLSNRQSADYWHKRAEEVADPDLRKEALATFREFRKLAIKEEKQRLRTHKPGYGVRSMFGWIILVALVVLAVILILSKVFSVATVCGVFIFAVVLCVIAAAVTLKVYGHISEDAMLALIQRSLTVLTEKGPVATMIAGSDSSNAKLPPPSQKHPETPSISFNDDDHKIA